MVTFKKWNTIVFFSTVNVLLLNSCQEREWEDLSYEDVTEEQIFAYQEKQKAISEENLKQAITPNNNTPTEDNIIKDEVVDQDDKDDKDVPDEDNPEVEVTPTPTPNPTPTPTPAPKPEEIVYFQPDNISLILNRHCLSCHDWIKDKTQVVQKAGVIENRVFLGIGSPMPQGFADWEDFFPQDADALKDWLEDPK